MIKKVLTTFLSFLLAILLVFSSLPSHVYAESGDDIEEPTTPAPTTINDIFISRFYYNNIDENYFEVYNSGATEVEIDELEVNFYGGSSSPDGHAKRSSHTQNISSIILGSQETLVFKSTTFLTELSTADYTYKGGGGMAGAFLAGRGAIELIIKYGGDTARSVVCWGTQKSTVNNSDCTKLGGCSLGSSGLIAVPVGEIWTNTRFKDGQILDLEAYELLGINYKGYVKGQEAPNEEDDDLDPALPYDDDQNPAPSEPATNPCNLIKINEISFADSHKFIEFTNESSEVIDTSNCAVKRGATKSSLERAVYLNATFQPGEIKSFDIAGAAMTQSNTSVSIAVYDKLNDQMVKVKDENGAEVVYQVQYTKVKEGASYAWFDDEERTGWFQTFAPTPNAENEYQQFQNCPAGKMVNPDTGNCVNIPLPIAECPVGQYRNPETGRCKKLPQEPVYVPCQEGYYRNPETGRCRKIETETSLKECPEGWERNPETGRCRKKIDNSPAGFAVQNTGPTPESNMLASFASGGVAVTGTLITASYRQDFMNFIRKFKGKR